MEILPTRYVNVPTLKNWNRLWLLGDLHLTHRSCIEHLIKEVIDDIAADKDSLVVLLGDLADCINQYDPRFDAQDVAPSKRHMFFEKYGKQIIQMLVDTLRPIAPQVIACLRGNHEEKFENHMDMAITQDVCETLKMPYGDYCCSVDIVYRSKKNEEKFRVFAHHGAGFATTTGGKINKLAKLINIYEADIYGIGHIHEQMDISKVRLENVDGKIKQRKKLCVSSGAFLATYMQGSSSYAEKKLYEPVALGPVAVRIRPEGRRLAVEKY